MADRPHVLIVAAENDALPGAKVGGIGDVVRDIPLALAEQGYRVSVVTPGYGVLGALPGARRLLRTQVTFGLGHHELTLFRVPGRQPTEQVAHFVLDGKGLAAGTPGQIYQHDAPDRPFASDAGKFALFAAGVAQLTVDGEFGRLDALHLHDWHAALVLVLRKYDPRYATLQHLHTVFSIHNLALQGVRPLGGDSSSLDAWFPKLQYEREVVADPRWPECLNPMAVGIRLADAVHTVSPSYAREVLQPSRRGQSGGEGLETDLQQAAREGRLHGILNGCPYPAPGSALPLDWDDLSQTAACEVLRWSADNTVMASAHYVAREQLRERHDRPPGLLLSSVGRLTDQKVSLLTTRLADSRTVLEHVLDRLSAADRYIVLGSGDPQIERLYTSISARDSRLLYLSGYSETLSQALYASGTLFLMPSSFEPCGISQMLAMRAGQPCLVHAVGGLRDTVRDGVDGFAFEGASVTEQAHRLLQRLDEALEIFRNGKARWSNICGAARAARFAWPDTARAYIELLYQPRPLLRQRAQPLAERTSG